MSTSPIDIKSSSAVPPSSTPARLTVFSLDYDGCADILFLPDHHRHSSPAFKERLKQRLLDLAKDANVEVFVGSSRQDGDHNWANKERNKNGDCFKNLEDFCNEQKPQWQFQRLLYPDVHHGWKRGTTMDASNIYDEKHPDYDKYWAYAKLFDEKKIRVIQAQLDDLATRYPRQEIDFYFFEDRLDILNALKSGLIPPPGIKVKLVLCDPLKHELKDFATVLGIEERIALFEEKAKKLQERDKKGEHITEANRLTKSMKSLWSDYKKPHSTITLQKFKDDSQKVLDEAKSKLSNRHSSGEIAANVACAIFLPVWLTACFINLYKTGNFLLFRTDTENKLDELRHSVNQYCEHENQRKKAKI